MRKNLDTLTVEQARAITAWNPGAWTVTQTPEGRWIAQKGDATLVGTNTRAPRRFRTYAAAISRLHAEVGVTEVRVLLPQA
jgi:hypothetical protein